MMKNRDFRIQKTLSKQMLWKLGRQLLLFLLITVVLAVLLYLLLRHRIWYMDDPLYGLLHAMNNNLWICATLFLVWVIAGMAVICCRMIYCLIRYMDDITEGVNDIYEDNSERLKMSPELFLVEEQLNEIRENVRRNRQAVREAEQRKMDLVIYLAHDLKTPLTSVIGYLTLLQEEKEISENLRQRYLGIALDKAERLEELTNEFFEITRFNLSEIVLEITQVNMSTMLEQMAYEFRPIFKEKNLTYRLELQKNVMLSVDVDKLSRVFDNLLKNAYYYSYENSEIMIRLGENKDWKPLSEREEDVLLQERTNRGAWNYYISFENHGKTIPKTKIEHIFEQFFRMESARSTRTGGAGLGLAIAREIIRQHGGEIICESEKEIIAFTIFLP